MPQKKFPHELHYIPEQDLEEKFREEYKNKVFVGTKRWCLPRGYGPIKEKLLFDFQIRPDDVWITGIPRSGTNLTQEMVWMIANDLDFKTSLEVRNQDRTMFLEAQLCKPDVLKNKLPLTPDERWEKLINMKERRFFKTHIPFILLPENLLEVGAKVVYVARNPKDVMTSLFNFLDLRRPDGYKLTFREHCELFMKGHHFALPYFEHIKEAWGLRHKENMLFLFYEDIVKDKRAAVTKVAKFLGKTLSEKEIDDLTAHLDIDNFKKHKSLNNMKLREDGRTNMNREHDFIRKGIVGDWKNYADEELDKEVNKWIEDGLRGSGISFKYE